MKFSNLLKFDYSCWNYEIIPVHSNVNGAVLIYPNAGILIFLLE